MLVGKEDGSHTERPGRAAVEVGLDGIHQPGQHRGPEACFVQDLNAGVRGGRVEEGRADLDVYKRQGKSTLLKTLAGQLAPQGGAVLLDGAELSTLSGNARARKMALMLPHTRRTELTTCFTLAAAGRYPYTGRLGVLSAEDRAQVRAALRLVGAEALADRNFNKISDGQRQRVLLALSLIHI